MNKFTPSLVQDSAVGVIGDMAPATFTVGRISPDGLETEVYAPSVLEPGMYSLSEAQEE